MTALTVLYVDDDRDIREIAELSLSLDSAITTRTAGSGAAGLALLDEGLKPDAILLDVMMPDLDGPGTLLQIRQRTGFETTPVIFVTARALQSEQAQFMALGAVGVIVKPFDPMTLARRVRDLLYTG